MDELKKEKSYKAKLLKPKIDLAQAYIYSFFLTLVNEKEPAKVLKEFQLLFFDYYATEENSEAVSALAEILFANDEEAFLNTIKRCCYILINNWERDREKEAIQKFVQAFLNEDFDQEPTNQVTSRLDAWLKHFVESKYFAEINILKTSQAEPKTEHWSKRYNSYLLVNQYLNTNNSAEQREAAKLLSQELRNKFKFDLAMYTARSEASHTTEDNAENPTNLGKEALQLIKKVLAKQKHFDYDKLANIFNKQIPGLRYRSFKTYLANYLLYTLEGEKTTKAIRNQLNKKLDFLYEEYDDCFLDDSLILRSCNRVIDYLTLESENSPGEIFILLMSQEDRLSLVIIMLKLILFCPYSRTHLETRVGELIEYYNDFPEADCKWLVHFFDIFQIIFTIFADSEVEYNLIKVKEDPGFSLDSYRIFSMYRKSPKTV
ncbi:MAG: hypothetical protein WA896_17255 [Spirulinaceae cyanobacterium]